MRNTKVLDFMGSAVLLSLAVSVPAAALEIQGTLRNVNGNALSGTITVVQETPNVRFTHHEVDETGQFKFVADSAGELLLHAVALYHPTAEHVIPAGTSGAVTVDFALP